MKNAISWFEIPCANLAVAQAFYEQVLVCSMRLEPMGPSQGAVFPYDPSGDGVGGALLCGPTASQVAAGGAGVLIYLDGGAHTMAQLLTRVQAAGGQVLMPSMALPDNLGHIAHIQDLDGNKIGLHTLAP
jgi:predicted enzyme related to lactoylglutathione lyase